MGSQFRCWERIWTAQGGRATVTLPALAAVLPAVYRTPAGVLCQSGVVDGRSDCEGRQGRKEAEANEVGLGGGDSFGRGKLVLDEMIRVGTGRILLF